LDDEQVEKLHDFEEDCMDDLARNKEYNKNISTEERIHRTAERSEFMSIKLNDLVTRESALKSSVREVESRLESIEKTQHEILACLRQLTVAQTRPALLAATPGRDEISLSSSPAHQIPPTIHQNRSASAGISGDVPSTDIASSTVQQTVRGSEVRFFSFVSRAIVLLFS
jgi:hypothetical protein